MVRVVILGQGYVGSIFAVGLERIKKGEIECYGVPLKNELPIKIEEIEIVGSYDVDKSKIDKSLYEVVKNYWKGDIPETLKEIKVKILNRILYYLKLSLRRVSLFSPQFGSINPNQ